MSLRRKSSRNLTVKMLGFDQRTREVGAEIIVRWCEKWWFTLWLCQNSYWNWSFIVSFPMKNCGSFHSYVSLPEGIHEWWGSFEQSASWYSEVQSYPWTWNANMGMLYISLHVQHLKRQGQVANLSATGSGRAQPHRLREGNLGAADRGSILSTGTTRIREWNLHTRGDDRPEWRCVFQTCPKRSYFSMGILGIPIHYIFIYWLYIIIYIIIYI